MWVQMSSWKCAWSRADPELYGEIFIAITRYLGKEHRSTSTTQLNGEEPFFSI